MGIDYSKCIGLYAYLFSKTLNECETVIKDTLEAIKGHSREDLEKSLVMIKETVKSGK